MRGHAIPDSTTTATTNNGSNSSRQPRWMAAFPSALHGLTSGSMGRGCTLATSLGVMRGCTLAVSLGVVRGCTLAASLGVLCTLLTVPLRGPTSDSMARGCTLAASLGVLRSLLPTLFCRCRASSVLAAALPIHRACAAWCHRPAAGCPGSCSLGPAGGVHGGVSGAGGGR